MGHHQEADGIHLQLAGHRDVLFGDIRFGTVGGNTNGIDAQFACHLQVIDGTDTRQQQSRDLGLLHLRDDGAKVLFIGMGRETVVDRGAAQTVTVGDFDQWNTGVIEASGNADHLVEAHQVTLGMHPVTQGHVVDGDFLAF